MAEYADVLQVVYACAVELNKQLPEEGRLICAEKTILVGDNGVLDSLGIVTLCVNVDQQISQQYGSAVRIMDTLMVQHPGRHPFLTMGNMARWIETQISQGKASEV